MSEVGTDVRIALIGAGGEWAAASRTARQATALSRFDATALTCHDTLSILSRSSTPQLCT